ncbi:hypothetical protein A1F94_001349 [Pyrenophora tritici-repentis]|nr:hypothetical protein A1F94_001349 [Pyrenophora tritici-repentis]
MPGTGHRLQPAVLQAISTELLPAKVIEPSLELQREGLQAYLNGSPGAYMDEMRDFLYDE